MIFVFRTESLNFKLLESLKFFDAQFAGLECSKEEKNKRDTKLIFQYRYRNEDAFHIARIHYDSPYHIVLLPFIISLVHTIARHIDDIWL